MTAMSSFRRYTFICEDFLANTADVPILVIHVWALRELGGLEIGLVFLGLVGDALYSCQAPQHSVSSAALTCRLSSPIL